MIVIAATTRDVADVAEAVRSCGMGVVEVLEPDASRRLVLVRPETDGDEAGATVLRGYGLNAVARPDAGAALRAWRRDTEPVVIRDRLAVHLAWTEHPAPAVDSVIVLGPGGFGSGRHPTTRMLLELLADRIIGGERVLDVGCGSGVLALAAVRLGAAHAVGVDRKAEAVAATVRNAAANGLTDRVTATADLPDPPADFDVVVANIAREGIVTLAEQLVARTAAGGWLAVSGITPAQCDLVADFLRPLQEVDRCGKGDWAALVLA